MKPAEPPIEVRITGKVNRYDFGSDIGTVSLEAFADVIGVSVPGVDSFQLSYTEAYMLKEGLERMLVGRVEKEAPA